VTPDVEIRRLIAEARDELHRAIGVRNAAPGPRKFLEVEAFAAKIRLIALQDALKIVEQHRTGAR